MRLVFILTTWGLLAMGQDSSPQCNLTLRVVDVSGAPLPYRVESIISRDGVEYVHRFADLRGEVPCDVLPYRLKVNRLGVDQRVASYTRIEASVLATRRQNWRTLSAPPGLTVSADGSRVGMRSISVPVGYVWVGRVLSQTPEKLWIHFRSMVRSEYLESEIESEVDENGEFRIYGAVFHGPYTVYISNDQGDIRFSALIEAKATLLSEPLVFSIPAESPPVVVVR
jgi:hypothetical protein